jgi:DNA helicase II / ATP-dependent DNA helicase PcrA
MQRRLGEIMGEAGAHVAVHTFHSFGAEIISRYPQYFYRGMSFAPANELTTHEVLLDIFDNLPHDHPLAGTYMGEYTYLEHAQKRISQLKRAAIDPDDLAKLIDEAERFIDYIEAPLIELFDVKSFASAADVDRAASFYEIANKYKATDTTIPGFRPLPEYFYDTFGAALEAAQAISKPKPLNDWKPDWITKNDDKQMVCKQRASVDKLRGLQEIYARYLHEMEQRRMFDFDDMIMRVVHALETRPELAYDLQEQYQYFLVDEFQDTNAAQLRMLHALAQHPVNEGRPNVMVVGDDDQAIYSFQGAELSNILDFQDSYQDVKLVTLTDNYRSHGDILDVSRDIITQGVDRLENRYNHLNKSLTAHTKLTAPAPASRQHFATQADEFMWIASDIQRQLKEGVSPNEIAVICRKHIPLQRLISYLTEQGIPVHYDLRSNALDQPHVQQLVLLARVVSALAETNHEAANTYMPELLSAPYWQIEPHDIWRLSLEADRTRDPNGQRAYWLECMQSEDTEPRLKDAANLLIELSAYARTHTLEETIDALIGTVDYAAADSSSSESSDESRRASRKQISLPWVLLF